MRATLMHYCHRLYHEHDKRQHFWVSLALFLLFWPLWAWIPAAAGATLAVGLGKEVWDHFYGTGFCWLDMAANTAGIGAGTLMALGWALAGGA